MGAVKQAYLASLEEECGIPQAPKLLRGGPPPVPSQSAPRPAHSLAVPPAVAQQCGLDPAKLMMARSMLCMKTSALPARFPERSFKTVEGTVLTRGSIFEIEGGPYYEYLDDRGRKAVKSLAVTGCWIFSGHYTSSQGQWIEAQRSGRNCRLILTPLPPTTMTPGLVISPYVIHDLFWRNQV